MDEPGLPPHLQDLERRISELPSPEPPAALRDRVGVAIREELRRGRARSGWAFAAVAAMAAAILLNLSMSAGLLTRIDGHPSDPLPSLLETATRIRAAVPEIQESEALREAAVLIAARFYPLPAPTPSADALRGYIEARRIRGD